MYTDAGKHETRIDTGIEGDTGSLDVLVRLERRIENDVMAGGMSWKRG